MNLPLDRTDRVCVIGAGCSGLAAARHLLQERLAVDVLERQPDLGGNWNSALPTSRVYRSTHTISSKWRTAFPDFPMPEGVPDYPHHTQVLAYLRAYAHHFGLLDHVEFDREVQRAEPHDGGKFWDVTLADGTTRRYAALVIANGHHAEPNLPAYPGQFAGQSLHSSAYKTPEIFAGRRVLVIGGGNSGCDIAVEAGQNAETAFHSTRRGYYYLPKYLFGQPADVAGDTLLKWRLPLGVRRLAAQVILRLAFGRPEQYGLPRPDHKLFETHPIVNSLLPYHVRHGDVRPKPDVRAFDGHTVHFVDGSRETIDLVVFATGYRLSFPFIDPQWLNWHDGRPRLYKHVFHPRYDTLFVAGMIQPDSGIFGPVHWQAKAIALALAALRDRSPAMERFRKLKAHVDEDLGGGIAYRNSPRHALEVEHWSYVRSFRKLAGLLSSGQKCGRS